jgi:hypothetical protein
MPFISTVPSFLSICHSVISNYKCYKATRIFTHIQIINASSVFQINFSKKKKTDPLNNDILSAVHCDVAWSLIGELKCTNGGSNFPPSLIKIILPFPYSNAACKRIFSI